MAFWLSPKTVETHIRGAFAKLGISAAPEDNRRVLAVLAYLRRYVVGRRHGHPTTRIG